MKKVTKMAAALAAVMMVMALAACSHDGGSSLASLSAAGSSGTGSGSGTGTGTGGNGGSVNQGEPETVNGTVGKNTSEHTKVSYNATKAGTYIVYSEGGGARFAGVTFAGETFTAKGTDGDTDQKNATLFSGTKMTVSVGSGSVKYDVSSDGVIAGTLKLDNAGTDNTNDKCIKIAVTEAGTLEILLNASGSGKSYTIKYAE